MRCATIIRMVRALTLNGIVALSLLFFGLGFLRSVFGVSVGMQPFRQLAHISYQAMSPFQRYDTQHMALAAEGRTAEGWERIDMASLFPGTDGESRIRMLLPAFMVRGDEALCAARDALRHKLLGVFPQYAEIRLWQESWPLSPEGEEALRMPPYLYRTDDCPTP